MSIKERIVVGILSASVVLALLWFVFGYMLDTLNLLVAWFINVVWKTFLFPSGWNLLKATPFFWVLVLLVFLVILAGYYGEIPKVLWVPATSIVAILCIFSTFMWANWNARHYNAASSYYVADTEEVPHSLSRIAEAGNRQQIDIKEDDFTEWSWEPRVASSSGAANVMKKTGDSTVNTDLMLRSATYMYEDDGAGYWTAIRNGTRRQPVFGVVEWRGAGTDPETCRFTGDDSLNKAFSGRFGMNLHDTIAKFKPTFRYDTDDVYGFCDDGSPTLVVPGATTTGTRVQAALAPYGVITVKGSPTGEPKLELHTEVEPGDFPGPVYPMKLTEKQREANKWSAGLVMPWESPVGYSEVGADFLLKSKNDGRLYWVTPMKPRYTDSQTIVAYSIIAADEIHKNEFNEQRIYVLEDGNSNIVNYDDLKRAVEQAVASHDPGFFTGDVDGRGRIIEFLPTEPGEWRVFAERGGRAVYEIHVSGGTKLSTEVMGVNEDNELASEPTDTPEDTANDKPLESSLNCSSPSALSDKEIVQCVNNFTNELLSRQE